MSRRIIVLALLTPFPLFGDAIDDAINKALAPPAPAPAPQVSPPVPVPPKPVPRPKMIKEIKKANGCVEQHFSNGVGIREESDFKPRARLSEEIMIPIPVQSIPVQVYGSPVARNPGLYRGKPVGPGIVATPGAPFPKDGPVRKLTRFILGFEV